MALTVEDGSGLTNAESYVSVARAGAYLSSYGDTVWATKSTTEQEAALRKATRFLDATYRGLWKGERRKQLQSLAWPRVHVRDEDNYDVLSSVVPQGVVDATCVLALASFTDDLLQDETTGGIKKEKVSVGPISEEIEYAGVKVSAPRRKVADALVSGLVDYSLSGSKVSRA